MQDETRYVAKPLEADQIDLVYPWFGRLSRA